MTQYKYYSLSDSLKEPMGKIEAQNLEKAIKKAAEKKQLSIKNFLELFKIEEV
jgi:hypothetical protein|tara:strand:- start:2692 stop:2850 length:159 start_codon:yes stop_codon:yes gene_type:complete